MSKADIALRKRWRKMMRRCYQASEPAYVHYGARGITVCDRWRGNNGFANFLADMGHPPPGRTLDRIDNDKGYSPDNCRWATSTEQNRNRRPQKLTDDDVRGILRLRHRGVPGRDVAAKYGISCALVSHIDTGRCHRRVVEEFRRGAAQ